MTRRDEFWGDDGMGGPFKDKEGDSGIITVPIETALTYVIRGEDEEARMTGHVMCWDVMEA